MTTRPTFGQRVRLLATEGTVEWVYPSGFVVVRMDNGLAFRTPFVMLELVEN